MPGAEDAAGAKVGLLDPLAIMVGGPATPLHRLRHLDTQPVAIPEEAAFLVVHCGVARVLGASPYATRRAECDLAANSSAVRWVGATWATWRAVPRCCGAGPAT